MVLVSLPPAFNQCFLLLFKNKSLYGSASAFLLFICKSDASDSSVQIHLLWEKICKTLKKATSAARAIGFLTSEGKHCIVIAGFCFLPCPLLPVFFRLYICTEFSSHWIFVFFVPVGWLNFWLPHEGRIASHRLNANPHWCCGSQLDILWSSHWDPTQ